MSDAGQSERRAQFLRELGIDPETLRPPPAALPGEDNQLSIDDAFLRRSDFVKASVFVDDTPPIGPPSTSPMKRAPPPRVAPSSENDEGQGGPPTPPHAPAPIVMKKTMQAKH